MIVLRLLNVSVFLYNDDMLSNKFIFIIMLLFADRINRILHRSAVWVMISN